MAGNTIDPEYERILKAAKTAKPDDIWYHVRSKHKVMIVAREDGDLIWFRPYLDGKTANDRFADSRKMNVHSFAVQYLPDGYQNEQAFCVKKLKILKLDATIDRAVARKNSIELSLFVDSSSPERLSRLLKGGHPVQIVVRGLEEVEKV